MLLMIMKAVPSALQLRNQPKHVVRLFCVKEIVVGMEITDNV